MEHRLRSVIMMPAMQIQFLIVTAVIAGCYGARMSPATIAPTTPSTPAISPVTITLQEMSTPPAIPVCADALDSTNPLGKLRRALRNKSYTTNALDAFIVFYSDEHLSEDPAPEDRRLEYISGWDGPGLAAVLADGGSAIWVASGDVSRARATVSCAWEVMDADNNNLYVADWIADRTNRKPRVGADARLTSLEEWHSLSSSLQQRNIQLVAMPTLVDTLWNEELDKKRQRPNSSKIVARLHDTEYTGMSWTDKVSAVRAELRLAEVNSMIVTALDEVSWLLNIRGRDLPHAPLLKAFLIVTMWEVKIYVPQGKLSMPVREVLCVGTCFNCTKVIDYTGLYTDLSDLRHVGKILIPSPGTFQRGTSAAIVQVIPPARRVFQLSPIIYLKAMKNQAEVDGIRRAHLRDAVAMCTLFSYIETKPGLDEQSVTKIVDDTRETQAGYIGTSMRTKVAFSSNAADPEYRPTGYSNRRVFKNATLVVQSGGQYNEGTTVVTRTVHFGKPTRDEKRAYSTVLRSLAALAMLNMPSAMPATHVDPIIRAPLWIAKQDYMHPTGYGVGAALNRKEDPVVIDYRQDTNLYTFREGYFVMAEPGWYEINKFGVRLGNVLEVVAKPNGYIGFRETTLMPYEPKLIDRLLLTEYEINWLNSYNDRIRKTVGPELKAQGLMEVYYWMMNKTVAFEVPSKVKKVISNSGFKCKDPKQLTGILFVIALLNCSI